MPSNTGSMFIEVLPVPMRPVRATTPVVQKGCAPRLWCWTLDQLLLQLGRRLPRSPIHGTAILVSIDHGRSDRSRDDPLSALPRRASRNGTDRLSSIRASLGAMLDDCFGAT